MASLAHTSDHAPQEHTAPATPRQTEQKAASDQLASQILLYSFIAAVVLAIGGFIIVAIYLFTYLNHAFTTFDNAAMTQLSAMEPTKLQPILLARSGLWKFILQSCGIISGVAFGFLGFALFLLGAKGDMDAAFSDSQHKVQLSRMAPGSFVILIAAVLVGVCSLNKVELAFDPIKTTTQTITKPASNPDAITQPSSNPAQTHDPAQNPNALP